MNEQGDKGIESLLVRRQAIEYAVQISNKVLSLLPSVERYALAAQLGRSAQSVSANIAEGYGRYYYQEGIRFCYIARESLEESYSHLTLACKMGYLPEELFHEFAFKTQELRKLLNGYIAFLKRGKRGVDEPGNHAIREGLISHDIDDDHDPTIDFDWSQCGPIPDQPVTKS